MSRTAHLVPGVWLEKGQEACPLCSLAIVAALFCLHELGPAGSRPQVWQSCLSGVEGQQLDACRHSGTSHQHADFTGKLRQDGQGCLFAVESSNIDTCWYDGAAISFLIVCGRAACCSWRATAPGHLQAQAA